MPPQFQSRFRQYYSNFWDIDDNNGMGAESYINGFARQLGPAHSYSSMGGSGGGSYSGSDFSINQLLKSWGINIPNFDINSSYQISSLGDGNYAIANLSDSDISDIYNYGYKTVGFFLYDAYGNPTTINNLSGYFAGVMFDIPKSTYNASGQGDENFSLASMYLHFQVGGKEPMSINSTSLDFSETSQRQLGLTGMKQGESREVNLFKTGVNTQSLAFGRLEFTYQGNNQFSIKNNMFDFDYQAGQSFSRNAGTILGGAVNYNVFLSLFLISPIPTLVPIIFGGPYNVIFNGNVTILQ